MNPNQEYISKAIAAEMLGLSERRVLEVRGIEHKEDYNPQTGRRCTVLKTADVQRVLTQRTSVAEAMRTPSAALTKATIEPQALMRAQVEVSAPPSEPGRPWITLDQAADLSGLPASYLFRLIHQGELPARDVLDGARSSWRIHRADLDALRGVRSS